MTIAPVAIAMTVSYVSAIMLLGVTAENYIYGTQIVVIVLSYLLSAPIVCYGFLPVFFKLQMMSAYEVSLAKFNFAARSLGYIFEEKLLLLVFGKAFRNKS